MLCGQPPAACSTTDQSKHMKCPSTVICDSYSTVQSICKDGASSNGVITCNNLWFTMLLYILIFVIM